jgi:uncharacterized coiled-coil DUF342 family protein
MDLRERREKLQEELQSKWNLMNELDQRRQALINEILVLQGKVAMLDELMQEGDQKLIVLEGGEGGEV